MSLPEGNRERDARALGDIVRAATEASEEQRRTSMPARRRDMASRQKLAVAIGGASASRGVSSRGRRTWAFGVVLTAVMACAALFIFRDRRLDYAVDGADGRSYVRASDHTAAVRFEEGTTFAFVSGSSGRVADVTAKGATVVLEDGSLEASVVHRDGGTWSALAGPWEVRVTGTRLDLAWDPKQRELRVDLLDGKVSVHGPGAESGIALNAGQTLRAREGDGIHVSAIGGPTASAARPVPAAPVPPVEAPAASGVGSAPSSEAAGDEPSVAPSSPSASSSPSSSPNGAGSQASRTPWPELVAKGKHSAVLAEANERGVAGVLASGSAPDLLALADAARYGGDGALAQRALQSLRDRFVGTKAATNAAFFLGRMADDGGSPAGAIRWYDAHIGEGGSFAAEALGRKMIAVKKTSGDAAARAVAEQYLARYPKGPHAPFARALVGGDVVDKGVEKGAPPR